MAHGQLSEAEIISRPRLLWRWRFLPWLSRRRERIALWGVSKLLRWATGDNNLVRHAQRELGPRPIETFDGNPDRWMHDHLILMVRMFCMEGHSGASASIARGMLDRLLAFKPLGPLTGEEEEWSDHASLDGETVQNRRCSHVFRDGDRAYDIQGFIFREPDGCTFTSYHSRRLVQFPHHPQSLVVDIPEESTDAQRLDAIRAMGVPEEDIWTEPRQ